MQWQCMKCGNTSYEKDEIRTTGGNLSKLFDVQNKKFVVISCKKCGFSELYKASTSIAMNILDFLTD